MITHNLGIVSEICKNVAVMYAGRIVEYGTIEEVFNHPMHFYTIGLLGSLPKLTGPRKRLVSIPGTVANPEHVPSGCAFHTRCTECMEQCKSDLPPMMKINENHQVACFKCGGGK
jgi:peptide/nickel transport system ATP-binding protein